MCQVRLGASLALIKLICIRYKLSLGQGLPFGALFSGLQASQASYLWSMEFWGTACSKKYSIHRRIGIICVISIAILLAAVIGPLSAILLTPKLAYWPAGSTDIWLKTLWSTAMTNTSTNGHGSILSQLDAIHSIATGYYQPYTSVVCEYDVIYGTNDTDPVAFPAYSGLGVQLANAINSNSSIPPGGVTLTFPNLTKSELLDTPGPPGEHRLRCVSYSCII